MYRLLKIGGSDAEQFLQGQLTQEVDRVAGAGYLPAAWLNAAGRVIVTLKILALEPGFGLVVPADIAAECLGRLGKYRLRADVVIGLAGPEWSALAIDNDADRAALQARGLLPQAAMNACRRAAGLHAIATGADYTAVELFGDRTAFGAAGLELQHALSDCQWQAARIRAGNVDIGRENTEAYTAHMLNLDLAGAISFDKGCYSGQEVVARTQHRGRSKRRLSRYLSRHAAAVVGDKLQHGDQPAGRVVNVAGEEILAVVPLTLHGQPLTLHGQPLQPGELPYEVS